MTPEFKDQLYGYLQLLRGKIKSMEQQIAQMNLETNQLRDDLEQSMQRELLLIDELR